MKGRMNQVTDLTQSRRKIWQLADRLALIPHHVTRIPPGVNQRKQHSLQARTGSSGGGK